MPVGEATNIPVPPSGQENGEMPNPTPTDDITAPPPADDSAGTPDGSGDDAGKNDPRFTKAQLDAAAASARRAVKAEFERKEAEANGEYQTLYQAEADRATRLEKQILLRDVCDEMGIPAEWRSSVTGDTEEDVKASAETLKARLDKIVQDAIKDQRLRNPGTPPPQDGDGQTPDDKAKAGAERTRIAVLEAMGMPVSRK